MMQVECGIITVPLAAPTLSNGYSITGGILNDSCADDQPSRAVASIHRPATSALSLFTHAEFPCFMFLAPASAAELRRTKDVLEREQLQHQNDIASLERRNIKDRDHVKTVMFSEIRLVETDNEACAARKPGLRLIIPLSSLQFPSLTATGCTRA